MNLNIFSRSILFSLMGVCLTSNCTLASEDPHSAHKQIMKQAGFTSSLHNFTIPQVNLIDSQNKKISLTEIMNHEGPVLLNFIFTSCTSICPVLSATFSQVQRKLSNEAESLRFISISIDPEQDTPERLKIYASKFKIGLNWKFLTGSIDDIINMQKAFGAYRGDKMNHIPLTYLRTATDDTWLKLEGFTSAAELIGAYRKHLSR